MEKIAGKIHILVGKDNKDQLIYKTLHPETESGQITDFDTAVNKLIDAKITAFDTNSVQGVYLPIHGNADTATKLAAKKSINISDASNTNTGTAISFDGSENGTIKLPSTIKASLTGNASTATKLAEGRTISLTDNDGTNSGVAINFDGSANATLKLPSTIKASLTGNASTASKLASTVKLAISDADVTNTSTTIDFNGGSNTTLKLPSTIKASLTGNASTASKLATPINIDVSGGVSSTAQVFDGSSDISIPILSIDATKLEGIASIDTTGNAETATSLKNSRTINVADASETNTGTGASFNGKSAVTIKLPETIKATLTGNASTATKLAAKKSINISDSDGTNSGTAISFDGSENGTIKLPSTIKATLTGNAATATKAEKDASGNVITATYAPINSPGLSGTPTAPTAASGTNTTQIATTAFVQTAIKNLVGTAPATLDTLAEIAEAINNDASVYDTLDAAITNKQPLNSALTSISGLSTSADKMIYTTAASTYAVTPLTSFARSILDDADAATVRTTIGALGKSEKAASALVADSAATCTGNAETATTLKTGRNINITDASETNTGTAFNFNGSSAGTIKLPPTIKATLTGNADTATKAEKDLSGNVITTTYAPLASPALTGTPTAPTATSGTNNTQIATTAFAMTAAANANTDEKVAQNVSTSTSSFPILTTATAGASTNVSTAKVQFAAGVKITPSTNAVTAATFIGALSGTAAKATADASGNTITSTYATKNDAVHSITSSGTTVTFKNSSGSSLGTFTTQDTHHTTKLIAGGSTATINAEASGIVYLRLFDNSTHRNNVQIKAGTGITVGSDSTGIVTITNSSTNTDTKTSYVAATDNAAYPLLFKNSTSTTTTAAAPKFNTDITVNPSTKAITATTFIGALSGTAAKATADASGNTITSTYAPLASPGLTGTPTAPTAEAGTNTTQIATTAFVQTGLSGKQPLNSALTSISGLSTAADKMIYTTAANTYNVTSLTAFARSILDDADAATVRTTIGAVSSGDTIAKATADASGNTITSTYATKNAAVHSITASGTTVTYKNSSGSSLGTFTTQDTHYTTKLIAGGSTATANAEASGTVYLRLFDNSTHRNSVQLKAGTGITVGSDSTGVVTITNSSTNTHYTTKLIAGLSNSTSNATASGTVYLRLFDDSTSRNDIQIKAGTGITIGSDSTGVVTITNSSTNTDAKMTQTVSTTNSTYPLLAAATANKTTTSTEGAVFASGVKLNPSTSAITATTFIGALSGNAATATKATQDASGNTITSTYAKLNSPALTGTPTAPTATSGTDTTQIATTAFVQTAIKNLIGTAPATLDTLAEIAEAINNDASVYDTLNAAITNKQDKHATLTSISGLSTAADKMIYTTAANVYAVTSLTSFARSILDDADAASVRTTIGAISSGGTVAKATGDASGNNIASTYATKNAAVHSITASGTTVTFKNSSGSSLGTFTTQDTNTHYTTKLIAGLSNSTSNATASGTVYLRLFDDSTHRNNIQLKAGTGITVGSDSTGVVTITNSSTNTDVKMTQTVSTTNNTYPLLAAATANKTATSTEGAVFASGVKLNPSTSAITATTFIGALSGTATRATGDASGNTITSTYATKTELTNGLAGKFDKLSREWHTELAMTGANNGKAILLGEFACYDSCVYADITVTSNISYHGTAVLATQNVVSGSATSGTKNWTVYGDALNLLTPKLYLEQTTNGTIKLYFKPDAYSKIFVHIQATPAGGGDSNILTLVDSIPSTATIQPTNALTSSFLGISATAAKATADASGNTITSTYATKNAAVHSITASGTTVTFKNSSGSSLGTFTTQDTNTHYTTKLIAGGSTATANAAVTSGNVYLRLFDDSTHRNSIQLKPGTGIGITSDASGIVTITNSSTNTDVKMTQTVSTTNNTYPLLLAATANKTATSTEGAVFGSGIKANPSTSAITATTFIGALSGNAATATKATQDASGNTITSTYATKNAAVHSITASGTTVTFKNSSGSSLGTFTTQDTNTHYTTKLIAGLSNSTANAAASGTVYLRLFDDSTSRNDIQIKAGTGITVGSDASGVVTITNSSTNTDAKMTQTVSTTNSTYPLLAAATANKTATSTEGAVFGSGVKLNPSTSAITATTFIGTLSGNASTATTLATPRSLQTNLASTTAASFNGSNNASIGVTGILPIANGGTGTSSGLPITNVLASGSTAGSIDAIKQ